MQLTKLFEPGKIGSMELKNRYVMAPMGTHAADEEGYITQRIVDYYVERARGGTGLLITSATPVLRRVRGPLRACLYDDRFIPGHKKLADAVHEYGAKIAVQLMHHGRTASEVRRGFKRPEEREEIDVISASPVPWVWNGTTPREATKEDIRQVVKGYAEAARRAKDAGCDAVEIHGAHGYLISQFLCPLTNRRTDEYGGSAENRARLACEVLAAIRKKVGPDFPIILRFSGSDFLDGGITLEDSLRQAPLFVEAGADALHVSASVQESTQWQFLSYMLPSGTIVFLAEAVKKVVKVPVITVGKLGDPFLAERILQEGKADFIALGRPLLADAGLPNKAKEGRFDDIVHCIYCNNCISRHMRQSWSAPGVPCTVNPSLLREREFIMKPTTSPKKVMVIGGGLAGMEAARVAAERGHQVSLYERSDRLGGQWNIAVKMPHKKEFATVTERLASGLAKAGVSVTTNRKVTAELVRQVKPDVAILATGGEPATPDCPGAKSKNVVQAVDVIEGKVKVGDNVVVIGGRYVGMEVACMLAEQGKRVSLATRRQLGRETERNLYLGLRDRLIKDGVTLYPYSPVYEITDNGVYLVDNQELLFIQADTVVLATGYKSENKLMDDIKGIVPETYPIGDCVQPRDALDAISEGAEIGRRI